MNEQKCVHTPGPWKTDSQYDDETVVGADGMMVADCCITQRTKDITQANARLIAAAPAMAARLKKSTEIMLDFAPKMWGPEIDLNQQALALAGKGEG